MVNILIGLGSPSDLKLLERLDALMATKPADADIYVGIASAHRTPEKVEEFARTKLGGLPWDVIIAGAGLTNALVSDYVRMADLGTIVIGLPISDKATDGLSSLLSSSELPPGYPVGCVKIDRIDNALTLGYLAASKEYDSAIVYSGNVSNDFAEKIASELKKLGVSNEIVKYVSKCNEKNKLAISAIGSEILNRGLVISGYPHKLSLISKIDAAEYIEVIIKSIPYNTLNVGILNPTNVAIYAAKIIGRKNPEILENIKNELVKGRQKYEGHKQLHVLKDLNDLKKLTEVK